MKNLIVALAITGFSVGVQAESEVRLNSAEAERACQAQIESVYASDGQIKFKARPTSSFGGGVYKFWINATEISDGARNSLGYLCEITRTGEVVQLMEKDGRWRA